MGLALVHFQKYWLLSTFPNTLHCADVYDSFLSMVKIALIFPIPQIFIVTKHETKIDDAYIVHCFQSHVRIILAYF